MPSNVQSHRPSSLQEDLSGLQDDPVCIVGMACHLPGDVNSPADLWQFLLDRKSAQSTVPPERYNIKGFYSPEGDKAGLINVNGGYFLQHDVRQFDNEFFGINNYEATYVCQIVSRSAYKMLVSLMDPQQRKLLEVVFECFENSGASLDSMSGSNTGVYVGNFSQDHLIMQVRDPDDLHRYHATGSGLTMLANRISHTFNLHGPSLTLDTACSSSIYCLHLAVNALKTSQCDGAIVAAANLILSPAPHIAAMKAGMLSPSSTCHTFDVSADGYARGEAVDAIYLKRLSSAIRNNDTIHAVIRGTAINSNGHTPGVIYPSSELQEVVIRKAYNEANIDFHGTDYIECHGTGTELGDLVELTALANCFSPGRTNSLKIGGSKPSFGHSEAASSLTSIIKVAMAFHHGLLPPTRGIETVNPKLELSRRKMEVVMETQPWQREIQRASICCFGYGGANAHAILESFSSYICKPANLSVQNHIEGQYFTLPISAASIKSLGGRVSQIQRTIQNCNNYGMECLSYTLAERVTHFRFRTSLVMTPGQPQTVESQELDPADVFHTDEAGPLPFAFIFTGQGAQHYGMGKELLDMNPVFLATIRKLDQVIQNLPAQYSPDWTLEDMLRGSCAMSQVHEVTRSQPVCTAIQIGLVNILHSYGVRPSATVGHSSGEIGAAYASELISASQAILAAYFRGYTVAQQTNHGAMLACGLTVEEAGSLIQELELSEKVCIACLNAPDSVTLSGLRVGIDTMQSELLARGKFCRLLATGGQAYHSPWMKDAGASYEQLLTPHFWDTSQQSDFEATMFSTVESSTNRPLIVDSTTNMAKYWRKNLENPVLFEATLNHLLAHQKFHLLEIGPHSALKGPINQIRAAAKLDPRTIPYSATLTKNEDANLCMKRLAGRLFAYGHVLKWNAVNATLERSQLMFPGLPPYPWDYSAGLRWFEPRASIELRNRTHIRHELLGSKQLAGSDIDWNWRNMLRVNEIPWIREHNIDGQVIFPAAAYLAMAIEAVSRMQETSETFRSCDPIFDFQHVSINSALVVPDDNDLQSPIELHTTMTLRKLSAKTLSTGTFDFAISSWANGKSVVHSMGSIKVSASAFKKTILIPDNDLYKEWAMDRWLERYREEGMFFGPYFQTLTGVRADSNQTRPVVQCTTRIHPSKLEGSATAYVVHPLTLDACLQATQISITCGDPDAFRAYVPVFISECRIQMQTVQNNQQGLINARSQQTGYATARADCVLEDNLGKPVVEMKGVRILKYMGRIHKDENTADPYSERHPAMRIRWKPDLLRLNHRTIPQLETYIDRFIPQSSPTTCEQIIEATTRALLDLAGHKNPRMSILWIGTGDEQTMNNWLNLLDHGTAFPRLRSWQSLRPGEIDQPHIQNPNRKKCDLLLFDGNESRGLWDNPTCHLLTLCKESSIVITRKTDAVDATLSAAGFSTIVIKDQIILALRMATSDKCLKGRNVLLLFQKGREPTSQLNPFVTELETRLMALGADGVQTVSLTQLATADVSEMAVCISFLEIQNPFFTTISEEELTLLHCLTNNVNDIVWLTGADMMGSPNPDLTLVQGLSRALRVEQPSLRLAVMDFGSLKSLSSSPGSTCEALISLLRNFENDDNEFALSNGLLYISRFEPDIETNSLFRRRVSREQKMEKIPISVSQPARLSIRQPGLTDTMYFQQMCEPHMAPPEGYIDVQTMAVSLNAKDVYTMSGHVETRTGSLAIEFGGLVTATGPGVTNVNVGDRVVVVVPNYFSTIERVPSWTAHRLLPSEQYGVVSTLPVIYCAALYAINNRAQVRNGETILIHSGAGAFGIATIAIAQRAGALVYTTCSSAERRKFLVDNVGIPETHIFNSRDDSFVDAINMMTGGRGVDVVINSLTGDLMHASWRCLAPFGRFIEVGKRETVDNGKLEMHVFARNTTFSAFDLTEMFFQEGEHYKALIAGLVKDVLELYRSGQIEPVPITTFDVSEISQAYRYFSSKDRIGKIVVSLENPNSLLTVAPAKYLTILDGGKVYLLVGALGGLGRSITQWMISRGAKKFVFLQRSGCDKASTQEFVDRLRQAVASVTACTALGGPLGGVVQAAMGLHEDLFVRMTSESWHASVKPKWAGTWNLHTAIDGYDESLDFFLMTSSMNGSVGIPTESNYCAANAFLDAFASWRRNQGKPATSLGLGMISDVGYLHNNPEIQALLLRRGIQPLNESDLLQFVDLAVGGAQHNGPTYKAPAHILTGLETTGIRKFLKQGFKVSHSVMDDPRSSILAATLEASRDAGDPGSSLNLSVDQLVANIPWLEGISQGVASVLATESTASSLKEAILGAVRRRFSHLVLTPVEQIDPKRALAQFGIDSMIAAEFRTWLWNSFKVEVPFLDLLSARKDLDSLAAFLAENIPKA
ncbi:hypothetical protein E0Z10_g4132 [Xylaria hypoxylon]|uniref:Uncharacterized protein n=1 Tax=Xylaria hypoxylon TaxID=37992 RepID=A0A4Z0YXF8_9PEZI|nr:hypothetical protein E0Z10_g4132 [Xylaria hypoxylon]